MSERLRHLEAAEQYPTGIVDPNGVVDAAEGTAFWDNVGDDLYYNTDGVTAWQIIGGAGTRYIADSVTIVVGGADATSVVANLRTAFDGLFFHLDEVAGAPGLDLIIDFVNVTALNWVEALDVYKGSATHAVAIQLYNWITTTWDTFNAAQSGQYNIATVGGYIMDNHSFTVPASANYIGTGGNLGDVRVHYYHTMMGNASHDLYIDCVALYRR